MVNTFFLLILVKSVEISSQEKPKDSLEQYLILVITKLELVSSLSELLSVHLAKAKLCCRNFSITHLKIQY